MAKKKVIIRFCVNEKITGETTPAQLLQQVSDGDLTFSLPDFIQIVSETGEILATNELDKEKK